MTVRGKMIWGAVAAAFIVFLLSPIILLVVFSFTPRTLTNFPMDGV